MEPGYREGRRSSVLRFGGVAGLAFPTLLVIVAMQPGFRDSGDIGDLAGSILGPFLFVIAAPTAWVFRIPFIDVDRFTAIAVGILTSFPLWYLLGLRLGQASRTWRRWVPRYLGWSLGWVAVNFVGAGILDSIFG